MEEELRRRNQVRAPGPAWFRTVQANGELAAHVADALEAFEPAPTPQQHADAHPFEAKGDGSPDCRHCPFPEANGRHRVSGYTARKVAMPDVNRIRSPADQRVADAGPLYAKYKAQETGGHRPWRNYPDPSVYDEPWPTT